MNPSPVNASLQSRLIAILGLTLVVGATITLATMIVFNRLQRESVQLTQKADALSDAWTLRNLTSRMERSQMSYLLMHDQRYIQSNERYRQEFDDVVSRHRALAVDPRLSSLYYELDREFWDYETVFSQIQAAGEQGDWELAYERARSQGIHLSNLQRVSMDLTDSLQPAIEQQLARAVWQVRLLGVVGLIVFLAFNFLIIAAGALIDRRLTRPMRRLIQAAQQISNEELDFREDIEPLMGFGDQLGDLTWALAQVMEQHHERKQSLEAQIRNLRAQRDALEKRR
jgi:CHASE3 domain sensor protein